MAWEWQSKVLSSVIHEDKCADVQSAQGSLFLCGYVLGGWTVYVQCLTECTTSTSVARTLLL